MVENKIICGNSVEVLREQVDSNSVDIIVTSPPYNIDIKYDNYNDCMPHSEYLELMSQVFTECFRVLKSGGRLCLNVLYAIMNLKTRERYFPFVDFTHICQKIGYQLFQVIVWMKGKHRKTLANNTAWGSFGSPSMPYMRITSEPILIFFKDSYRKEGNKENIDITTEEFVRDTQTLWFEEDNVVYEDVVNISNTDNKTGHPAPFSVELVERLLKIFSYKNDLVLDPFNGSGSTTKAASLNERRFIGIDLSEKYCNIARERLGLFGINY